jgi:hypothetical protein
MIKTKIDGPQYVLMMSSRAEARSTDEIRRQGIEALASALGPVDAVRFIQIFELGKGDYTKDRAKWLDIEIGEISRDQEEKKKKK